MGEKTLQNKVFGLYQDILISLFEGKFQKSHIYWSKYHISIGDKRAFAIQMVMPSRKVKT